MKFPEVPNPESLLQRIAECDDLDYKAKLDSSKKSNADFVKDVGGISNIGGGVLVFGVLGRTLQGIPDEELPAYDPSRLGKHIEKYLAPPPLLSTEVVEYEGRKFPFVKISATEGAAVIVCRNLHDESGKVLLLREGSIYTRQNTKTVEISSESSSRKLIDRIVHDKVGVHIEHLERVAKAGSITTFSDTTTAPSLLNPGSASAKICTGLEAVTSVQAIKEQFLEASSSLLRWPTDLGNGEVMVRPELSALLNTIQTEEFSTTIILGPPGCGKSALLASLGKELIARNIAVLAIKADCLAENIKSNTDLQASLDFESSVSSLVLRVAASEPLVLLIDQLDALAQLVDLRPARLNVLLNLVREHKNDSNVHIVCSSREFERRHDARLAAATADELMLSLPGWDQVAEILKQRGIVTGGWPEPFKELLRTPQHIKVFLQRIQDTSDQRVFSSYQDMLDDLWSRLITGPKSQSGTAALVVEIASAMADHEHLWVPSVLYEDRKLALEYLIGHGIIVRATEGSSIGFAHQTLYEHARARSFTQGKSSLSSHTLARQDGLFVRSTVWTSLLYLRGANRVVYRKEFGLLWNEKKLRRHLRHLLIEFLGTIQNPEDYETAWLVAALGQNEWVPRVLVAVRGNIRWFDILGNSHLPQFLHDSVEHDDLLVALLVAAWPFRRERCIELLQSTWLSDPSKDYLSWRTFSFATEWDEGAVEVLCMLCQRSHFDRGGVIHMAIQVAQSAPALAPRIVAAAFRKELGTLEAQSDPVWEELTEGTLEEYAVTRAFFEPKKRFKQLLEDLNGWYGIEEIAEKAPKEFVQEIWPLFRKTLFHVIPDSEDLSGRFREDYCMSSALNSTSFETPLFVAIDAALVGMARAFHNDFIDFFQAERSSDSMTIQRILARGLAELQPSFSSLILGFLLEDQRRLWLGPHSDEHAESVTLIQKIGRHLSGPQFADLEGAITHWSGMEANRYDVRDRLHVLRGNRMHQARLISELPADRLSKESKEQLRQASEAFPDFHQSGISRTQSGFMRSPMSVQQMELASDEEIKNLFRNLTGTTNSSQPRHPFVGGSYEASSEFATFSERNPERAIPILFWFQPGLHERTAGSSVAGLSKSIVTDERLFQVITDLDAQGFNSPEFRADAARAIRGRLKDDIGLPQQVCDLLEKWLSVRENAEEEGDFNLDRKADDEQSPSSILWGNHGGRVVSQGSYQILDALTYGYLLRKPRSLDRWLKVLNVHLERPERVSTWLILAHDLRFLRLCCNRSDAEEFLSRLFSKYPEILANAEGIRLLANLTFVSSEKRWHWFDRVKNGPWAKGQQAYGELIALAHLRNPDDTKAEQAIEEALSVSEQGAISIGIGFACANLWTDFHVRERVTNILVRLILANYPMTDQPLKEIFIRSESLPADESTRRVLAAFLENPSPLFRGEGTFFVEKVEQLLPYEADVIYQLCLALVENQGKGISDKRSWPMYAANLTNIALTLHRLDEPSRSNGLELFERLLDIRSQEAESALREIDLRPTNSVPFRRQALRRRRPRGRR